MKRVYRLEVRLNQEEYKKMHHDMKICNLPQSTYLRKLIMDNRIQEALPRDYYRLWTEVNRIGNNINQVARIANTQMDIYPYIDTVLNEISNLYQKMIDIIDSPY